VTMRRSALLCPDPRRAEGRREPRALSLGAVTFSTSRIAALWRACGFSTVTCAAATDHIRWPPTNLGHSPAGEWDRRWIGARCAGAA
jgi:hypothetical protein